MYKMVVLDLDGTLLNSKSTISEKNKIAIQKCIEQGIKVVLASGRMHYSMYPIVKELQLDEHLHVACNGNTIFSLTGHMEDISLLEDEVYKSLIEKIKEEEIEMLAFSKEYMYYDDAPKLLALMNEYKEREPIRVDCITEVKGVLKIGLYVDHKDKEKEERIRKLIEKHASIIRSHELFLDIVHYDTSKYTAVERLMKQYDIHPKQVIAIGDSENDREMIKRVGFGVAMANGSEIAKKAAKYIAPKSNDEDGVADIIERFALKKIS